MLKHVILVYLFLYSPIILHTNNGHSWYFAFRDLMRLSAQKRTAIYRFPWKTDDSTDFGLCKLGLRSSHERWPHEHVEIQETAMKRVIHGAQKKYHYTFQKSAQDVRIALELLHICDMTH